MIYTPLAVDFPPELSPMVAQISILASDLRWTWSHAADELWEAIDPFTWEQSENPYAVLQNLTRERLLQLSQDKNFCEQLDGFSREQKE